MRRILAATVLVFLAAVHPAAALTDKEIFRKFRFNLINPSGRAIDNSARSSAFLDVNGDPIWVGWYAGTLVGM